MDLDEAKAIIKGCGWTPRVVKQANSNKLYAVRRIRVGNALRLLDLNRHELRAVLLDILSGRLVYLPRAKQRRVSADQLATVIERAKKVAKEYGWRGVVQERHGSSYFLLEKTYYVCAMKLLPRLTDSGLVARLLGHDKPPPLYTPLVPEERDDAAVASVRALVEREGYRMYPEKKGAAWVAYVYFQGHQRLYLGKLALLKGLEPDALVALLHEKVARRQGPQS